MSENTFESQLSAEKKEFNKIMLLNDISNQIIYYGMQCGNKLLQDFVDMNCGAIPDGSFEQIVDAAASHEFLRMYEKTVEMRFAYAVTALLKMNAGFINQLEEFCFRTGKEMQIPAVTEMKAAYEIVSSFYLDGLSWNNPAEVMEESGQFICWKTDESIHADVWQAAGGNICVYWQLVKAFVDGLLDESAVEFSQKEAGLKMLKFRKPE